ncbi:MAG TPA: hypothetical protein VK588_05065, partial [Chitinophagaceae bacterium]|nr:hypothetical protein [Chitinophagaceae bacterium]
MNDDRFWELLSKQAFAEANEAELKELEESLPDHPDWKNIAETLLTLSHQSLPGEKNQEVEAAFEKHIERIRNTNIDFKETYSLDNSEPEIEFKNRSARKIRKWVLLFGAVSVVLVFSWIFGR